jgi:hypothetical protein
MDLVTAWLLCRHVHGRDAQHLLDFKHPVALPYFETCISWKQAGRPYALPSSNISVICDVIFHGPGHIIVKWKEQKRHDEVGCKENQDLIALNVTWLCIQCFVPDHNKWNFVLLLCWKKRSIVRNFLTYRMFVRGNNSVTLVQEPIVLFWGHLISWKQGVNK